MKPAHPFTLSPRHLVIAAMLAITPSVHAHDTLASGCNLWVRPTGMDMELLMARSAGVALISKPEDNLVINADNFDQFKDRLAKIAPTLFDILPTDGAAAAQPLADAKSIKPDKIVVSLTDENDIRFDIHYPLPAAGVKGLRLHAAYVTKMIEGHVASVYVMDQSGHNMGWSELSIESQKLDLDAKMPSPEALIATTTTAPTTVSAPAAPASPLSPTSQKSPASQP